MLLKAHQSHASAMSTATESFPVCPVCPASTDRSAVDNGQTVAITALRWSDWILAHCARMSAVVPIIDRQKLFYRATHMHYATHMHSYIAMTLCVRACVSVFLSLVTTVSKQLKIASHSQRCIVALWACGFPMPKIFTKLRRNRCK